MSASGETVAVLGAGGTMGLPIARNIARAGIELHAWNRTRRRMEPLAAAGAQICGTPAEAASEADVVLTMLSDLDAVLDCMASEHGAISSMRPGSTWVQMSTIGVAGAARCAELAAERSIGFLDAPVLGTRQPAEEGKLVVLASGPRELRSRLQPLFDAIAHRTIWAGEAGAGSSLKMVANSWVLTVVEGAAETIALAEGLGVDAQMFFDAIEGGTLDLPYLRMKGRAIMERDFPPAFRLALAAKDAGLMEQAAAERGLDLPLLATIARRLAQGAAAHGEQDVSATYLTSAPED